MFHCWRLSTLCCNALYHSSNIASHSLSEMSFRKLMLMVTSGVEFSFDDIMYRQVDGVAMGSPLGPLPANIFVVYCESCIPEHEYPLCYCRFADDSFAYCLDQRSWMEFKHKLCYLHPSLQFTHELESNMSLSFFLMFLLNVLLMVVL